MEKEKIERAAIELCTIEEQEPWAKDYGVSCFMDGARWRIDSAWHDGTASCEARRKALVLFKNGNAAYERVLPQVTSLQTAIANALGRYPSLPDRNTCAAVVVAQSLAHEAAEYVKRRAAKFTNFTITTHDGRRMSVSSRLASMSCAGIDFCLKNIARILIEKHLPCNVDLAADPSVMNGLKAVLNVMADPKTWAYARDKADRLNELKVNNENKD